MRWILCLLMFNTCSIKFQEKLPEGNIEISEEIDISENSIVADIEGKM